MSTLWTPGDKAVDLDQHAQMALTAGRNGMSDDPGTQELRQDRIRREGRSSITMATPRPRDPMFYWRQNNMPYDPDMGDGLKKIREYCKHLYIAHPLLGSAIDLFSTFPLAGMEVTSKDPAITAFYEDHFMAEEQLNYGEFLVDLLRAYWTYGEAWPFGSFSDVLGIWEDDELIHPDDVEVERSPFEHDLRFLMKPPRAIRNLVQSRSPLWEYEKLMKVYPELNFYQGEDSYMPVSNVLLRQVAFKADLFGDRGLPILLRSMRSAMQEEMLNAAQDAIADRLYTPLVLMKLGATAQELGTDSPWIPTEGDIARFEHLIDAALAGDMRVLTTNFGVRSESVFGRESMPDFSRDFDRLAERSLQSFGMSMAMLSGAHGGETYAADALNRDIVSQRLSTAQQLVKAHFKARATVVAEAREHWDFEVRGGKRYPIMEEVLEVDPESGEQRIIQQPKLLIPELKIKAMDVRREEDLRRFIEAAVASNVPVSQETRFVNLGIDLEAEREKVQQERVEQAIAEQETRKATYEALRDRRLPIPADLLADFEPKAQTSPEAPSVSATTEADLSEPIPGLDSSHPHPALVPPLDEAPDAGATVQALPRNKILEDGRTRPPESDEQRRGMPVAAAQRGWGQAIPVLHEETVLTDSDGESYNTSLPVLDDDGNVFIGRMTHGPIHVGMRRYSVVDSDVPLPDA